MLHLRTQLAQTSLMHVERAGSDGVAAGKCDFGFLAPADQRPEDTHRRTELPHRGEVRVVFGLVGRGDAHDVGVEFHGGAESAQHLGHQWYIEDVRAVGDRAGAFREQCRGHQFQHAVLGAPNSNFAR